VFDVHKIRADFPILAGPDAYLDSAATAQKPQCVIDALTDFYSNDNANVYRAEYDLARRATERLESARQTVADFIQAASPAEIVFTSGATDALNRLAAGVSEGLSPGDEILVSAAEHHSNFVPWQRLCQQTGAAFRIVPLTADGGVDLPAFETLCSPRTKVVAVTQVSNVTGKENPVKAIARIAHAADALCVVDGAQGIVHRPVSVRELDCDFYCFSAHKLYSAMGTGVLYGKKARLEKLQPALFGGEMVDEVGDQQTTFASLPLRHEAGTPNVGGIVALERTIQYIIECRASGALEYEAQLTSYAAAELQKISGLRLCGTGARSAGIFSFNLSGIHFYDAGFFLARSGIAVRSGSHCAQPLMRHFGVEGTVRVSLAFYNTEKEIDRLTAALRRLQTCIG